MTAIVTTIRLAGYALGAFGSALLFVEFFQQPSYVTYDPDLNTHTIDVSPSTVVEHTWAGRAGALSLSVAFVLEFLAAFL